MKVLQKWFKDECNNDYSLEEIEKLKNLYLFNDNLTSIPKEISKLKNLQKLDLDNNNLTSLPKEIGELKNLKNLYLSNNNLTSLPKEFGELKNLAWLYISNNDLTINKNHKELIKLLDKHDIKYTLADDSLITDILI